MQKLQSTHHLNRIFNLYTVGLNYQKVVKYDASAVKKPFLLMLKNLTLALALPTFLF